MSPPTDGWQSSGAASRSLTTVNGPAAVGADATPMHFSGSPLLTVFLPRTAAEK